MKHLPIGISSLRSILEDDMTYVDKTGIIEPLARVRGRYFLSRPRRFGKSLLVDTFRELFEGNEKLFRGLAIHDKWDWSKQYPVVKIDFAGGLLRNEEDFRNKLTPVLDRIADSYGVVLTSRGLSNRLSELIQALYHATESPIVFLVDEYDKPLLDNIENVEKAAEMRDLLKDFYSPIKELDGYLQFVFLTGVSKFSKVSIFSGINNLKDISLDAKYAVICGYTQRDLESVFAEHLAGVDWDELKIWYNGFNFLGERVYNPFDILLFISEDRKYRNFWFETGTPGFLVKLMRETRYFLPDLSDIEMSDDQMSSFEVDRIPPVVLLFQSGYLTIEKSYEKMGMLFFRLTVPNQEVRLALSNSLFSGYTEIHDQRSHFQTGTYDALITADMTGLEAAIRRVFSGIPWQNFTNNGLPDYEGLYASVLYAFFVSINCTVIPEDLTNHGQVDMTVRLNNYVYVMEIKAVSGERSRNSHNTALEQIQARGYAAKYMAKPESRVFEIGMVFGREQRNLLQFAWNERLL